MSRGCGPRLLFDVALVAEAVAERRALGGRLRAIAARDHEVDDLMGRLVSMMQEEA